MYCFSVTDTHKIWMDGRTGWMESGGKNNTPLAKICLRGGGEKKEFCQFLCLIRTHHCSTGSCNSFDTVNPKVWLMSNSPISFHPYSGCILSTSSVIVDTRQIHYSESLSSLFWFFYPNTMIKIPFWFLFLISIFFSSPFGLLSICCISYKC